MITTARLFLPGIVVAQCASLVSGCGGGGDAGGGDAGSGRPSAVAGTVPTDLAAVSRFLTDAQVSDAEAARYLDLRLITRDRGTRPPSVMTADFVEVYDEVRVETGGVAESDVLATFLGGLAPGCTLTTLVPELIAGEPVRSDVPLTTSERFDDGTPWPGGTKEDAYASAERVDDSSRVVYVGDVLASSEELGALGELVERSDDENHSVELLALNLVHNFELGPNGNDSGYIAAFASAAPDSGVLVNMPDGMFPVPEASLPDGVVLNGVRVVPEGGTSTLLDGAAVAWTPSSTGSAIVLRGYMELQELAYLSKDSPDPGYGGPYLARTDQMFDPDDPYGFANDSYDRRIPVIEGFSDELAANTFIETSFECAVADTGEYRLPDELIRALPGHVGIDRFELERVDLAVERRSDTLLTGKRTSTVRLPD